MTDIYERLGISPIEVQKNVRGFREIEPLLLMGKWPSQGQFEKSWRNFKSLMQQIIDLTEWGDEGSDPLLIFIAAKLFPAPDGEIQTTREIGELARLARILSEKDCPDIGGKQIIQDKAILQAHALKLAASMFVSATGRNPSFSSLHNAKPGSSQEDFPALIEQFCADIGISDVGIRDRFKELRRDGHI